MTEKDCLTCQTNVTSATGGVWEIFKIWSSNTTNKVTCGDQCIDGARVIITQNVKSCSYCTGKFYYNFACVDACPAGTISVNSTGVWECKPCPMGCLSCTSTGSCNQCNSTATPPLFRQV